MGRLVLLQAAILFSLQSIAQLSMPDELDFGLLRRADQNWREFEIWNRSDEKAYLFRIEGPKNIDYKFSGKEIPANSNITIRVAVTPKSEGPFKYELAVFTSSWQKPGNLIIKGESTYASDVLIPCPDFSGLASSASEFHVSTLNQSGAPIPNVKLTVYNQGEKIHTKNTDENGELDLGIPYGRYLVSAEMGDLVMDTTLYVNSVNNHLKFYLPDFEERGESIQDTREVEQPDPDISTAEVEVYPDDIKTPEYELSPELYKENNLIFLVDVSTSMRKNEKLDLMKLAMISLLNILRPYDRFTLISYASDTQVLVRTQGNLNKEECRQAILALEAGGNTAGAKAIDKAGKSALQSFIEQGNNQIILASDGAFNNGVDQALRYAKKYARKDIHLSIIGIKCGPFTTKQMKLLAEEGEGSFIPLENSKEAGVKLIEEVKRSSRK